MTYHAVTITMVLSSLMAVAGCAALNDPNALAQVGNDNSRVVVTQADKRAIFMFGAKNAYACPEPSPDVRADIDSTVRALLDVSAKLPDSTSATAKTELDATRKLITAALVNRSQGLQVLRDMLFQACLANLRGDMSAQQYHNFVTASLPRLTSSLIAAEMVMRQEDGKTAVRGDDLKVFLNFMILNQQ